MYVYLIPDASFVHASGTGLLQANPLFYLNEHIYQYAKSDSISDNPLVTIPELSLRSPQKGGNFDGVY